MERGIYFDGWYKNNHCYHPSLPLRSRQMIEDIEKYRGTLLVWSAMGGGSISLPYLEHEAYGEVDPRMRFYGYLNDHEFIKECGKHGIKVFGIVFQVQGWEFPVVIGNDKRGNPVLKEFNVTSAKGEQYQKGDQNVEWNGDWYGLREFTEDKHWELFGKKFIDYFPDGLYNSEGERVTDLWHECCSRTYKQIPVHADWVEVKNHEQIGYQMCRNNPVWRTYLKKIMEIMIDAGVQGIQLDECELPMTSMWYGGCFCKDCMKGFNEYLKLQKQNGNLHESMADFDLDNWHYGKYIQENNLEYPRYYDDIPVYRYYWDYQLRQVKKYNKELIDHAKAYSQKTRGDHVLMSGNFFTLMPTYFPVWEDVDVIITEMKNTLFKQPAWYRYAHGFAGNKSIIIAENPYGGIIPELLEMLDKGLGYDLYRIFLLEAAVYGCNMSVPYGGWMGNTIKNAFHPPRHVTIEIQDFIADNEHLFPKKTGADVGVVWSYPSNYWREAIAGYSNTIESNAEKDLLSYHNTDIDSPNSSRLPFWEAIRKLSEKQVSYDVLMAADGDLRADDFTIDMISHFNMLVLPDCTVLTKQQLDAVKSYADLGKTLLVFGRIAENSPEYADSLRDYSNVVFCDNPTDKPTAIAGFWETFSKYYKSPYILSDTSLGIQKYQMANGNTAFHIINYDYDKISDAVKPKEIKIWLNDTSISKVITHVPSGEAIKTTLTKENGKTSICIHELPVYMVLEVTALKIIDKQYSI